MRKRNADIELNLGELPSLPSGWKWGRVEDAASDERNAIVDGPFGSNLKLSDYIPPPGVPVLTTANIRGDYSPDSVRYISVSKFHELKRSEVRGGDILMAKIGSCGLTGVYPEEMPSAIIPANLLKMTVSSQFVRKFVLYYFGSPTFAKFLKGIITATAQPAFNVTKFRQLPLPIVPKDDQRRIVAELEKQFTRLEAGVAALRRVQANLKRYRAAVLKAACEGRLVPTEAELARGEGRPFESGQQLLARILTERRQTWQGRGKYKEPAAPDPEKLPPLPEGWTWATLDQLTSRICNGLTAAQTVEPVGVPASRIETISAAKVNMERVRYVDGLSEEEIQKWCLKIGDILFSHINSDEHLGKTALFELPDTLLLHGMNLLLLRKSSGAVNPKLLHLILTNLRFAGYFMSIAQHAVNQSSINIATLKEVCLPLPPLAEQTRIVAEVERRLSVVEELEAVVTTNLQRATRLRQSILQKAFTGELFARP